ncbi:MAG TPA: pilus assembly protein TadG-related protein [Chloroflexota bacterium]|jgi:Flp pilus assembly protein TadG|nr:pilus assembly protein TadG-related protein [Chloroflexota bacterium]
MPYRVPNFRQLVQRLRSLSIGGHEPGQIIVLFAVFLVVLMVLAGSAYDYASIVVDDARLQNAVDAAALAGSNSLSANAALPGTTPVAIASATTAAYLTANGVTSGAGTTINMTFPASTPVPGMPTPIAPQYENIQLSVTRNHPTAFWPLIGINQVSMHDAGSAHAARNMVDVMLSLDTTGSEVISGSLASIQAAVGSFVTTMAPSTTDTRGPQVGIARFAGIQCQYDVNGNYNQGCVNDWALLTPLTNDRPTLLAVANGPSGSPCPTGAYNKGGCPIEHLYYNATGRSTSPDPSHDPFYGNGTHYSPGYTGTKLPNGFFALGLTGGPSGPFSFSGTYAWSTANGGRNNATPNSPLNARKVMVMMTDGQNEMYPTPGPGGNETVATYDSQMQLMADTLQKGPDGIAGTYDDVEVYVVGYFCTPYQNSQFCQSQLADTSSPHPCPSPVYPSTGTSPIDNKLNALASSTPGSCDHYFPLSKNETTQNLAGLFSALAGRISRGALTQ